jgi:hypothetical protein
MSELLQKIQSRLETAPLSVRSSVLPSARLRAQVNAAWRRFRVPYEVGTPARTTVERLGELAFRLEELGETGQPPITAVTER